MGGGSPGYAWRWGLTAGVLYAATLALFWPGYALYDATVQFQQALAGRYDDWHPPIMAWLWRRLHLIVGGEAGPMLAAQLGEWWLGLGLIAAALAHDGRARAAGATLAVGLLPPFLGWQVAVLKDAQMAGALLAVAGLVAWWRLRARPLPWPARAAVAILLIEATLLRANAVFAVAPFAAALASSLSGRARTALAAAFVAMGLLLAGPINHDVFGAARSGVERTQAIYDLAAIAARAGVATDTGLTGTERQAVIAKGCASPFFWDPLGDAERCADDLTRLYEVPPDTLYGMLARAVLHHPLAYAGHRLAHLNSTERWLIPPGWPGGAPPIGGEPNTLGLHEPGRAAAGWQALGGTIAATPLGWPVVWIMVGLGALAVAVSRPVSRAGSLAIALAASALSLEASFAAVSIASDLRYHLWPMVASALAAVLVLADGRPARRLLAAAAAVLGLVMLAGGFARAMLPQPPRAVLLAGIVPTIAVAATMAFRDKDRHEAHI